MRVWLPDRPGALGAVASRIGAVRGDLVGIDILERGGGRVIDELTVTLPDDRVVELLAREVSQVDGVDVEDVRPLVGALHDPRLDALETASMLVEARQVEELLDVLALRSGRDFSALWAVVLGADSCALQAGVGAAPSQGWLAAFVAGTRSFVATSDARQGPADVAWASLEAADAVLVLGREGQPFRARERRQLAALAHIADCRWSELALAQTRRLHPSAI